MLYKQNKIKSEKLIKNYLKNKNNYLSHEFNSLETFDDFELNSRLCCAVPFMDKHLVVETLNITEDNYITFNYIGFTISNFINKNHVSIGEITICEDIIVDFTQFMNMNNNNISFLWDNKTFFNNMTFSMLENICNQAFKRYMCTRINSANKDFYLDGYLDLFN